MRKYTKELILWALMAVPFVYLAIIWEKLPERVPTHFNIHGVPDAWSGKTSLIFLPAALGIGTYLLMLAIPALDPKKKIQMMGSKYFSFRLMLTFSMTVLTTYLLYVTQVGSIKNPGILMAIIGGLFAMCGNYFQTIRPNYFVGIRTPWTLESEHVWRTTHLLAGRLWMAGGISIVLLSFILSSIPVLMATFISLTMVMVLVPVIFSYMEFRKEKTTSKQ
jgi:uncharacterized membrane protein